MFYVQIKTKLYVRESLCNNFYLRDWDIQVIPSKAFKNKRNKVKGKISNSSLPSIIHNVRWRKWSPWSRQVWEADRACRDDSEAAQPLANQKLRSKEGRAFTCCVVAVCVLWSACFVKCVLQRKGHSSSSKRTPQLDRGNVSTCAGAVFPGLWRGAGVPGMGQLGVDAWTPGCVGAQHPAFPGRSGVPWTFWRNPFLCLSTMWWMLHHNSVKTIRGWGFQRQQEQSLNVMPARDGQSIYRGCWRNCLPASSLQELFTTPMHSMEAVLLIQCYSTSGHSWLPQKQKYWKVGQLETLPRNFRFFMGSIYSQQKLLLS